MKFTQLAEPQIEKPLMVAALQDMGNVGNLVINHINKSKKSVPFRRAESTQISYVLDQGGYIEIPKEGWQYSYAKNIIVFGGGVGQPKTTEELHELCQDVIDTAKRYSVKFIYSLGGFHTTRPIRNDHKTYVTTTSQDLTRQLEKMGTSMTPTKSVITGFNGLILGYAKTNDIQGIGLYGELNDPSIPQYRTAKSVLQTLEKLTYQSFGDYHELDVMADDIERKLKSGWNKDY
ncbi:PAC2 family protein [Candidatus Nitrosotenuis cloacae]|uniref:PAC2 family protein n=1 Tax=Candidatus Nitrosotenuis cloacae TaxID=1603555 RepID=UPI002281DB6C|nr:PAC2 family protein [Candidatus Nitrosotenuis cloacae]